MEGASFFRTHAAHHLHHFRHILITHYISACFDDPALVGGNLPKGIPQIFCVFQAYIGNDRDFRCVYDIC